MATVAELQARFAKEIADGKVKAGPIHVQQEKMPVAGALTLEPAGVRSETYGSLAFQTPVIEMDFDSVSTQEARLYRRWRDGYQRNWSNFFDPIGIQFRIDGKKIAADVTVMPLIDTSEYRELIDITRNGKLKPTDGDPHADVLMHWVLALNKKSGMLQMGRNVFQTMVTSKLDPLSWIGDHVAVYFDDDKQWEELAKIKDMEELSEELSKHFFKLPIGVHLDVSNGFKLTLFLTAVKAYIEQAAPGMTIWENREHAKVPYVRIAGSERAKSGRDPWEEMAIYYLVSGKSLVLSLNEDVIHRAIDRQVAKKSPDAKSPPRWLGKNVALTVDAKMLRIVSPIVAEEFQQRMQTLAFNNLPILNEWKKRFPDDDPVAVHQRIWKTTLICPAGGQYVWNDEWQTMESTIYGHPARPKKTRKLPTTLESLENGSFGLTFEPNGLRARVQLKRK